MIGTNEFYEVEGREMYCLKRFSLFEKARNQLEFLFTGEKDGEKYAALLWTSENNLIEKGKNRLSLIETGNIQGICFFESPGEKFYNKYHELYERVLNIHPRVQN